jgi:hypothetical protein
MTENLLFRFKFGKSIFVGWTPASIEVPFVGSINKFTTSEFAHSLANGDVINRGGVGYLLGGPRSAITHNV